MDTAKLTWITVVEAAVLLKLKPATVIRRIQKGMLPSRTPTDMPFTNDGKENYEIRLDSLPVRLQYNYLYSHLPPEEKCSLDLVTPRSALGNAWLEEYLDISAIIREANEIKRTFHGTGNITAEMRKLAVRHHIALSTLYRLLSKPAAVDWSALYDDSFYLQITASMCLWSCDLAYPTC